MLIVEDQEMMRHSLREFLQAAFPHETIREAQNAHQALAFCRDQPPRLVLMDVQLPDGNGIDLTAQLKAMLPDTAIIVVSQHSAQPYVERALGAGADAYITKDKVYRELLPAIERHSGLRRNRDATDAQ
ncbi:MAG TPA: response regulator transcription factor [Burkholderiales bacterium]